MSRFFDRNGERVDVFWAIQILNGQITGTGGECISEEDVPLINWLEKRVTDEWDGSSHCCGRTKETDDAIRALALAEVKVARQELAEVKVARQELARWAEWQKRQAKK